jgi:hypothetical protein
VSHLPYNFRKCRKLVTSVANDVRAYCHADDTKETLKTSHVPDLKQKNWLTEDKELLTPEESFETKVLRGSAPLYQP